MSRRRFRARTRAMGTFPFDAAGRGRRGFGWNPSQLGLNTLLFSHGLELLDAQPRRGAQQCVGGGRGGFVCGERHRARHPLVPQHPDEQVRELILQEVEPVDQGVGRRVRPEQSGLRPDGLLRPADDHRARSDGGGRGVRPLPPAPAERRPGGTAATAVDRSRAVAVVAQSALAGDADAEPRAVRRRVPARWAARGVPLLAGASWRDDVLPARGDVTSSACRRRMCCTCTSRFAPASSAASRG